MASRRFPAPWRAEKMPGGYVVRDANDQAIAYIYSRANLTDAMQAKVLTDDEARRVAANIAKRAGTVATGGMSGAAIGRCGIVGADAGSDSREHRALRRCRQDAAKAIQTLDRRSVYWPLANSNGHILQLTKAQRASSTSAQ